MTTRTHPLDPREIACPRCKGGGLSYLTADSHGLCDECHGTGRVALHPTPTVEVWEETHNQRLGKGWWARCEPEKVFPSGIPFHNALGPHPTEADALREARLAYLGARVKQSRRGQRWCVSFGSGHDLKFGAGPTPDDAIAAAFAAMGWRF